MAAFPFVIVTSPPPPLFTFAMNVPLEIQRTSVFIICTSEGISDSHCCANCTQLERDRDGCPKIINLESLKTDLFIEKRLG